MKTERKIQLIGLIFLIIAMFATTSCQKYNYCAECHESTTGLDANFCSTEKAVDEYISTIKSTGTSYGQKWTCKKYQD